MTRPSLFTRKKPTPLSQAQGAPSGSKPPQDKAAPSSLVKVTPDVPEPNTEQPNKRQKARDIGDTNVTEEELYQWRRKTQEDKDSFILKGTSELLVHLHHREERRLEDAASMKKAEEELTKLKEDFKSQRVELKKATRGGRISRKY